MFGFDVLKTTNMKHLMEQNFQFDQFNHMMVKDIQKLIDLWMQINGVNISKTL